MAVQPQGKNASNQFLIPQLIHITISGTVCIKRCTKYDDMNQLWNQKLRFFPVNNELKLNTVF
jgi:hypothetical protein